MNIYKRILFMAKVIIGFFLINIIVMNGCTLPSKNGHDGLAKADCMPERKNTELFHDLQASVMKIGNEFILQISSKTDRYYVCNLPESYKTEGTKVRFTVQTKEIFPNERLIGIPGYLISLEKL